MSRLSQRAKSGIKVSPNRLSANRRNAHLSTGPKSTDGKRASSLNALRHGLTSRVSFHGGSPVIETLTDLIDQEIHDRCVSEQIAIKILEFERVLSVEYEVALKQSRGEDGYRDPQALKDLKVEMSNANQVYAYGEANRKRKDLRKEDKEEMKLFWEIGKFFQWVAISKAKGMDRMAREEASSLRRYFKRASNQLIKAIKGAADPRRRGELD